MATDSTRVEQLILQECQVDDVGLWEIVDIVETAMPGYDVMATTMNVLRRLLSAGSIRAGAPTQDGKAFIPWDGDTDAILSRIEFEWRRLRRSPSIGEIVWFVTDLPDTHPTS